MEQQYYLSSYNFLWVLPFILTLLFRVECMKRLDRGTNSAQLDRLSVVLSALIQAFNFTITTVLLLL